MNSSSFVNQQESFPSNKVKKLNLIPSNIPAIQIYKLSSKIDEEAARKLAQLEFPPEVNEANECKFM